MKISIRALKTKYSEVNKASAVESKMVKAAEMISFVHKSGYVNSRKHVIGYEVDIMATISTSLPSNIVI